MEPTETEASMLELAQQLVVQNAAQFVRAIQARTEATAAEVLQSIHNLLSRASTSNGASVVYEPSASLERVARYASAWTSVAPKHAELRAATSLLLEQAYQTDLNAWPAIAEALCLADPDVASARAEFARMIAPEAAGETPAEERAPELELAIEREVRLLPLEKGATLCRQGEPADALYILLSGRLGEFVSADAGDRLLAEIATGDTAGETELLTGDTRPATIRALRDSSVMTLDYAACRRLIDRYPAFLMALTSVVIRRFRDLQAAKPRQRTAELRTLALLPLTPDVPVHEFARSLARVLAAGGETRHLTRAAAELALEEAGDALLADTYDDRLVGWANQQEARSRFVIYEAESEPNAWTSRCLRQADRVLLLAFGKRRPSDSELVQHLTRDVGLLENVDLALLQDDSAAGPSGTREWLREVQPHDHYHLRLKREDDFRYLARRLLGQAIGLVCGGGGARAFASVGAVQAIREAGLPIDLAGGTSAGSFVAAMCAAGWDRQAMSSIIQEHLSNPRKNQDLTLPLVALSSAKRMTEQLKRVFGTRQIEDLWRPFFCITSNLTRAEMMVHRSGPLWRYVRASCSIPTLLPPLLDGGDLLVDGMLLNNLPADVMSELTRGGPVIAIDVSAKEDAMRGFHYGESVSGFEVMLGKLRHDERRVKAPSIIDIILRTTEVGSLYARKAQAQHATVHVVPPVMDFNISATDQLASIAELGYTSTKAKLADWLADSSEARAYLAA
ncbi:MAG: patatin-like phospholipase family protein [Chloroflexi bacterium]|nr:patatin-like phospholipase family protein [Chloroflexota bacterium]